MGIRLVFRYRRAPNHDGRAGMVTAVAERNGRTLGKLLWRRHDDGKWSVDSLWVDAGARRRGIATAMYTGWMQRERIGATDLAETAKTKAGRMFREAIQPILETT